jgi:hypothetical protein
LSSAVAALIRRLAVGIMLTAALAFAFQCMFVAASEAATGDTSHYYLGYVVHHTAVTHSHLITHRHSDGTIHRHAIDDDDGALAKHVKDPGSNMALVICVLPIFEAAPFAEIASYRLDIEKSRPLTLADIDGLRRPPRTPGIA